MRAELLALAITCMKVLAASQNVSEDPPWSRPPSIEHRVSEEDAKSAAKTLHPDLMVGIGCKNCSEAEVAYCDSPDAISDHCCCDRKFHEVFPYIPHTCYIGPRYCVTVATHCGEFARLLMCCCHRFLADKWKKIANVSWTSAPEFWTMNTVFLAMAFLLHHLP